MAQEHPTMHETNVKADDLKHLENPDNVKNKEGEEHTSLGEILHINPSDCGPNENIEGNKLTGGWTEDREVVETGEKKTFMEKMKDKLPGAHKNNTVEESTPVMEQPATKTNHQDDATEKKGFMEKIKDKLPGHHKDAADAKTVE
ncbi:hypothetical protein ACHQM5_015915 [Ranunculus cassubicifolius]